MKSEPNFFLIHGSFSSPFSNWLPWLFEELQNRNMEVYIPDFPTGVNYQNYKNWSKILRAYLDIGLITENTIIFAHSIAPVFICKFLIENKTKVKKIVSVCGFNNYFGINEDYDAVNQSMYLKNLHDIRNYCNEIICFYSDNDPYVRYEAEKDFADIASTRQIIIKNGGHLNSESGYQVFPELLEFIEK